MVSEVAVSLVPPWSVTMTTQGCELEVVLDGKRAADAAHGELLEVRIRPAADRLEPHVLRRLMPQAPLYLNLARAFMQSPDDAREALRALREVGATRRGLGDDFYRRIARDYTTLVGQGERHPVKALAELHHVVISTASRWVKEARRRSYIEEER
jgi:hypothetical protein